MAESREGPTPPPDEDLIRRLSGTVLRSSRRKIRIEQRDAAGRIRGRETRLLERLTARNADRLAELVKNKPIFYENQEGTPQEILLDADIQDMVPPEFFKNPTAWIESQPDIDRGYKEEEMPSGETIEELRKYPYDFSKVKRFKLKKNGEGPGQEIQVVSKRIGTKHLQDVVVAIHARESGIPTPRVLGEILDRGNAYAWFEDIPSMNLDAAMDKMKREGKNLRINLAPIGAQSEEDFAHQLNADLPAIQPGSEEYARLHEIWASELDGIRVRRAAFSLADVMQHPENLPEVASRIPSETLQPALGVLGFNSMEEFIGFATEIGRDPKRVGVEWRSLDERTRIYSYERLSAFEERWKSAVAEICFGFDVFAEAKRLEELCIAKKVHHPDLGHQNMLVPWDFESDQPLPPQPGKPPLYIVDWEQEPGK